MRRFLFHLAKKFPSQKVNSSMVMRETATLNSTKLQDFRLVQNESHLKLEIPFGKGRKCCGKRRKCWLPTFSPFLTKLLKFPFHTNIKTWDCVVKN